MTTTQALTAPRATSQAASRVRNLMPGSMINASSRTSWDLDADVMLIQTDIYFPPSNPRALDIRAALSALSGVRTVRMGNGCATVIRTVA